MMILRKKTIIIVTLVLLIVAAGYVTTKYGKIIKVNTDKDKGKQTETVSKTDTVTSTQAASGYFIDVRIGRENTRTLEKQTLTELINNQNTSKDARTKAENQYLSLVDLSEKEMITEALIKSKNFEDAVVFLTADQANVTVKAKEINAEQVNVIKNIVCRLSEISATKVTVQSKQ